MSGTVFKVGSTLTTGTTTTPGIKITFNVAAMAAQSGFAVFDFLNDPVWFTGPSTNPVSEVPGDFTQARNTNSVGAGFDGRPGRSAPGCMFFPTSQSANGGTRVFSMSGVPAIDTAVVGDVTLRTDTPTTTNQRVYQCTTAGNPGTHTARL